MLSKLNDKLKGFRGLFAIWIPYLAIYIDTISSNLSGITLTQLKAAAILSVLPTLKLIWTDARPKILNWIADHLAK